MTSAAISGVVTIHLRFVLAVAVITATCIGQVATNPKIQPRATTGTRLVTLGTAGGPLPTQNRTQSSNLLTVNGTHYVIDAGDNVTRRIVQAGADFRQIGKIFITHCHSDHTMGLATLLVSEWEFQRQEPIDIYGPPGVEALVKGAIQA
jgi:ribonuclease BN (tRNA processing enzyme)